jgi:hypothetical protein
MHRLLLRLFIMALTGLIGLTTVHSARADLVGNSFFPAHNALQVSPDTPLRINFDAAPRLGNSGRIRVLSAATGNVVDVIVLGATTHTRQIGNTTYNYHPVIVAGNVAHVQLHRGVLGYNSSYYVQIDAGVFLDAAGAPWAGISDLSWRFTTKATGPSPGTANVIVADDGTGDFASIQGAFDFVPVNNPRPIVIQVRNGTYREMLLLQNRPFVTLRGQDRRQTVIAYANNANLNAGNSRAMVGIDSNDFTLENLTLRNLTPAGGSQAEALRTNSQRCFVSKVDFSSFQDTLFINGRVYFTNCYIEGDVDFIWGGGAAFFERCEVRALRRGYNVQSRSARGQRGYVFVECALTANSGVTAHVLARTDTSTFADCEVAYIDCTMGAHISPAGWLITGTGGTENLRFLEYRSRDAGGAFIDVSQRAAGSRQMTDSEAAELRQPANVLSGWVPPVPTDTSSPGGIVTNSPVGSTSRLVNVSVGSLVGAGDQMLIAGFSLRGNGTKPVLVRGVGPALGGFGVTDVLPDPRLQVFDEAGGIVAENDDWNGVLAVGALAGAVGAFSFVPDSKDAALVATVGAGSFTAHVRGAGNTTGRAQIEVYDGAPGPATLGLTNLSARTQLVAGDTLVAGFVISGAGERAVLIRAIGPGLGIFGLVGTLADPRLELYNTGGSLFENENWTSEVEAMFPRVGAFALDSGSKDAALLVALSPGAYTAHVRGIGTGAITGGVVLLEIYDVP